MFQSFNVQNFRGFREIKLEGLGRVNLVVGKNNTGKTSLLEALALTANPSSLNHLPRLFRPTTDVLGDLIYRWLIMDGASAVKLCGTLSNGEEASVSFLPAGQSPPNATHLRPVPPNLGAWATPPSRPLKVHVIPVQHRDPDTMVDAFAEAVRSPVDERQMESLLALIDPRIKSIRLDAVGAKPFIVADVGLSARVPLGQAGQGVYRLVSVLSELLGHKPKICLIDEIEDGLHYSVLSHVWSGLAEIAERLDIQIFATTHSWECLVAAHDAFSARTSYDLRVIQLYRAGDATGGRVLDRAHIEAAIAGTIEVR